MNKNPAAALIQMINDHGLQLGEVTMARFRSLERWCDEVVRDGDELMDVGVNGEPMPFIIAGVEPETRAKVDDLVSEFAALRAKVARLEAENEVLRWRLAQHAGRG